jgi:hypothetical protein
MANDNSIDDYVAARLAGHYARVRLREAEKAERTITGKRSGLNGNNKPKNERDAASLEVNRAAR